MSPSSNVQGKKSLYYQVREKRNLRKAWAKVRQKGLASKSYSTREKTKEFDLNNETRLSTIQTQLYQRKFKFSLSEGITQKKPGKKDKRPIVISPVRDRVVQRAILDVLQSYKPLDPFFNVPTSFGGLKDKGVPDAIRLLHTAVTNGATHFVRSDIKSFFTRIPKPTVISKISNVVGDGEFLDLFTHAIHTELANIDSLSAEDRKLFPLSDIGVAQGSSLSPLIGNILLSEFDVAMNEGDITCIRYIDDFIIIGPSSKAVRAAFTRSKKILAIHGLEVYDPIEDPNKAESGETNSNFSFLGCDLIPGMIQPSKISRTRLISNLKEILAESASMMAKPALIKSKRLSVTETLISANNVLMGWGNQYAFCNNDEIMAQLDGQVDELIAAYLEAYRNARIVADKSNIPDNRRRLIGVHLLTDSKKAPIIQ